MDDISNLLGRYENTKEDRYLFFSISENNLNTIIYSYGQIGFPAVNFVEVSISMFKDVLAMSKDNGYYKVSHTSIPATEGNNSGINNGVKILHDWLSSK